MRKLYYLAAAVGIGIGILLGFMVSPSSGAEFLDVESDQGQTSIRVFESDGTHMIPFRITLSSEVGKPLYDILTDSSSLTFPTFRWHRKTVITSTGPYIIQVGTVANMGDTYDMIIPTTTKTYQFHEPIYLQLLAGSTTSQVRGYIATDRTVR